jgi:two-component system LytT family response regulator
MIRTIIIDDEPLAIESLSLIIKKKCRDDVESVATTNSARIGKILIEEHRPDLVFIDVEMPGMSGIDLVRSFINPSFRVVFVTAFDMYAIEALRLSALDYLLKPVEPDEIFRVVQDVKFKLSQNNSSLQSQMQNFEKVLAQSAVSKELKIAIGMADRIVFVSVNDILYCKAEGPYTHFFLADGKKIVASKSLGEFELQLTTRQFFRIHHSTLINLNHVTEFQRFDGGYVIMANKEKLEVSHRKRNDFLNAINDFVV